MTLGAVMAELPAIHVLSQLSREDVDGWLRTRQRDGDQAMTFNVTDGSALRIER